MPPSPKSPSMRSGDEGVSSSQATTLVLGGSPTRLTRANTMLQTPKTPAKEKSPKPVKGDSTDGKGSQKGMKAKVMKAMKVVKVMKGNQPAKPMKVKVMKTMKKATSSSSSAALKKPAASVKAKAKVTKSMKKVTKSMKKGPAGLPVRDAYFRNGHPFVIGEPKEIFHTVIGEIANEWEDLKSWNASFKLVAPNDWAKFWMQELKDRKWRCLVALPKANPDWREWKPPMDMLP